MDKNNVLVSITASRAKDEIVYRVECPSELTNEESEYYLSEIIGGTCTWKKDICEGKTRVFEGKSRKERSNKTNFSGFVAVCTISLKE